MQDNHSHPLSLYELNGLVREAIETVMPDEYWVEAELSEVRERGGHCYMELIEKDSNSNTPIAKASAKCWRSTWMIIRPEFERITGQIIHAGMKVLMKVYPQFHENYGFSWIVSDIDPTFTMGDMARKRLEIIAKLKEEGVFELNKELRIPLFAQRIAVISSAGAAGYGDFCNQLENNDYGFKFTTLLFPAIMQGEQVERSVIEAMNEVNRHVDDFDVLVIIRGGGATSDLSGFDTLSLAENVANFPLPVITGIGHERDESVLDMISNTKVKTPTAAAALLIDNLAMVYNRVCDAQTAIVNAVSRRIEMEHLRLSKLTESLPMLFSVVKSRNEMIILSLLNRASVASRMRINRESNHIDILSQQCRTIADRLLTEERHRIEMLCLRMEAVNPQHILERGYSITLFNGHALHDAKQVNNGDEIETRVEKGVVKSIIKK